MRFKTIILLIGFLMPISIATALSNDQNEIVQKSIDVNQEQIIDLNEKLDLESDQDTMGLVTRTSKNGIFSLGGRLHRVVMIVADGASTNGFFMDSDQGPTMLRADISKQTKRGWTVSGALEVGIQSNRAFRVNQENPNPGTDITVRFADLVFENNKVGKFSFGRGFAAAWVVPEVDLSGTVPAALLSVGNLAPGMRFVDNINSELSLIQVSDHFVDTERLLLTDRFRFDSKKFGGGMQLSGSIAADARWDAAFRYYPSFNNWSVRVAATYQHKPFRDIEHRGDLAFSTRNNHTGLSFTVGVSMARAMNGRDPKAYVFKGGWIKNLNRLGHTAFSIDYAFGDDALFDGDKAESIGFFAMQKWDSIKLDLYTGYRSYVVSRPDIDLRPLKTFTLGAIFAF